MLKVHHLENSRSQRILWLLEELGAEYELVRYARHPKTNLGPPELRKIHPLGKAPLVEDGGVIYAETGAILEHLIEAHGQGRLQATTEEGKRLERFWMHYGEGSLMPILLLKLIFTKMKEGAPLPIRPFAAILAGAVEKAFIGPQSKLHLGFVNDELGQRPWLTGDEMTIADILMSFPLEAARTRIPMGENFPHVEAYVAKIHARAAYKTALEKGGPYAYA